MDFHFTEPIQAASDADTNTQTGVGAEVGDVDDDADTGEKNQKKNQKKKGSGLPVTRSVLPFEWNLERIIDDWVMLNMLVGNDFIPHLPTLDIGESGLNTLFKFYREELPHMGGYITEGGK
jgi:hypothetical protein